MYLINREKRTRVPASIGLVTLKDFQAIAASKEFLFDWKKEKKHEVYKLYRIDTGETLGLMSCFDFPEAQAVEIKLLETGQANKGSGKKLDRIAGCLIAWACRRSVQKGYGGWIMLRSKTILVAHYKQKYGMVQIGNRPICYVDEQRADWLIAEYLE